MIDLSQQTPFAGGEHRLCYTHPDHPGLCLKVLRPGSIERRYQRQSPLKRCLGRRRLDDNRQEQAGYAQRVILRAGSDNPVWRHLPRFHGVVPTTDGPANVTDLIRDDNGQIAPTLSDRLAERGLDEALRHSLTEFADWLLETGVLSRNLLPHNLVARSCGARFQLFLVDGLGAPGLTGLAAASRTGRRRYIARRIDRMWVRARWEANGKPGSWEAVEAASRRRSEPL
ncbi:hypothetical protein CF392_08750 [Tamilnaduibacter salinus]|uniref:PhoP regulatory network protein YrbL n=1 Tax=Tamilnaduibacter salinus TaxID=1484056 RepID=A0A2A2I2Q5_9GAMM|nr:YrbL family protein [Tamilnaduibacter salinus]PAV25872.1 hypothetical protein CF392_08750 [Tamilnaduibacter salinus]